MVLGAIFKAWAAHQNAKEQIKMLDNAIAQLERECSRPVLDNLSGIERFQGAVTLLDSSLLIRIESTNDLSQRAELVEQYLGKLHEEYGMARDDLREASASRAEVVALGLALKELALRLDQEIDEFQAHASDALSNTKAQVSKVLAKAETAIKKEKSELTGYVEQQTRKSLEGLRGEINQHREKARADDKTVLHDLGEEVRKELREETRRQMKEAKSKLEEQVKEARGVFLKEIRTVSERARDSLAMELDEKLRSYSAELSEKVSESNREQEQRLGQVREVLETRQGNQEKSLGELATSVEKKFEQVSQGITEARLEQDRMHSDLVVTSRDHEERLAQTRVFLLEGIEGVSRRVTEIQVEHGRHMDRVRDDLESASRKHRGDLERLQMLFREEFGQIREVQQKLTADLKRSVRNLSVGMILGFIWLLFLSFSE